jgi:hypothetical protein
VKQELLAAVRYEMEQVAAAQGGNSTGKVPQEAWRAIAAEVPVEDCEHAPPPGAPAVDTSLPLPPTVPSSFTVDTPSAAVAPPADAVLPVTPQQVFASPRVRMPVEDLSDKAWLKQFVSSDVSAPHVCEGSENVRVFCRVRPLHGWEQRIGVKSCVRVWGDHQQGVEVTHSDGSKSRFTLSACLDESATQEDTFNVREGCCVPCGGDHACFVCLILARFARAVL